MDPVEALKEIGFWLERELAKSYRVEAFRKAAAAIEHLAPAEVEKQVQDGSLKRVKGIGDRTFGIIAEAVAGEVPGYLADLRERGKAPLAAGGAKLRAKLRGDLHSHSNWSDGGSPIQEMAARRHRLGREYQVTDRPLAAAHDRERTVGRTPCRAARRHRRTVDAEHDDLRLLSGIEVDILDDGEPRPDRRDARTARRRRRQRALQAQDGLATS